jgi:hypothetical protein
LKAHLQKLKKVSERYYLSNLEKLDNVNARTN